MRQGRAGKRSGGCLGPESKASDRWASGFKRRRDGAAASPARAHRQARSFAGAVWQWNICGKARPPAWSDAV